MNKNFLYYSVGAILEFIRTLVNYKWLRIILNIVMIIAFICAIYFLMKYLLDDESTLFTCVGFFMAGGLICAALAMRKEEIKDAE